MTRRSCAVGWTSIVSVWKRGVFIGYRQYEQQGIEPLFPFGFRLSYTNFEVSAFAVSQNGDSVDVTVSVTDQGQGRARPSFRFMSATWRLR